MAKVDLWLMKLLLKALAENNQIATHMLTLMEILHLTLDIILMVHYMLLKVLQARW